MDSKTVIDRLGGPTEVSRICGGDITPQAVSQWYGVDRNGKERTIPDGWRRFLQKERPDAFMPEPAEKARATHD